jgi:Tol biopolymer transport system component
MRRSIPIALALWLLCLAPVLAEDIAQNIKISDFRGNGGRLDWSRDGRMVVFDRKGDDGKYDLYMSIDSGEPKALTVNHPDLPNGERRNFGQPAFDPTGRYIVFQAEKETHPLCFELSTNPGAGIYNDIWIYDLQTNKAWPLWVVPNDKHHGVLHPQFSHDGKQLSWSDLYKSAKISDPALAAGAWKLKVADFSPRDLSNVKEYQPGGEVIYENHGFTTDDQWLLFTTNWDENNPVTNSQIYKMHLKTQEIVQLTDRDYNEHAHMSPDGKYIVWMSTRDLGGQGNMYKVGTEYWIMRSDGSGKQRLTYFNDEKHTHFRGLYGVSADFAWDANSSAENGYRFMGYIFHLVYKNAGRKSLGSKNKGEFNFVVSFEGG